METTRLKWRLFRLIFTTQVLRLLSHTHNAQTVVLGVGTRDRKKEVNLLDFGAGHAIPAASRQSHMSNHTVNPQLLWPILGDTSMTRHLTSLQLSTKGELASVFGVEWGGLILCFLSLAQILKRMEGATPRLFVMLLVGRNINISH